MLQENLKALRKQKGYTQEELAARLNVVRQTISKWEKGQSVPDSEMLMKLAEIFEVSVGMLLGSTIEVEAQSDQVAEQLARINEQLVIKNRRSRRIWRVVAFLIGGVIALNILLVGLTLLLSYADTSNGVTSITEETQIIDE